MPTLFFSAYTRPSVTAPPNCTLCLFNSSPQSGPCLDPATNGFAVNGPFVLADAGTNVGWGITVQPIGRLPDTNATIPGGKNSEDPDWALAYRCPDFQVHDSTVLIYGSRYTNPDSADYINFQNENQTALYEKINNFPITGRGYIRVEAGLNSTGVAAFLTQHTYQGWKGVWQPFSMEDVEVYHTISSTSFLSSDDTDLVWATNITDPQNLLNWKELMVTITSFNVENQRDVRNSILAPISVILAVMAFLVGQGRYRLYGRLQQMFLHSEKWTKRTYAFQDRGLGDDDVESRLRRAEEFILLLRDHYVLVHPSMVGADEWR
ncbi:hypothetical protein HDV00_002520 [Rhizophlyctis rosea]|nr:hypothetical protein HDV00_002520 [Rhizophlyctis rosea]